MAEVLADELDDYGDLDFDLPADGFGDLEAITYGEFPDLGAIGTASSKLKFNNLEEFTAYLTERHPKEEIYGSSSHSFLKDITMCRFFETKNNENILADIEQKTKSRTWVIFKYPIPI